MNNKQIGTIGEAAVLKELLKYDIPVYLPFGDNNKSDMVIEVNKKLYRIQVKTANKVSEDGTIHFRTRYTSNNRKNFHNSYSSEDIDFFILYSIELDESYLVSIDEVKGENFYIRIEESKTKQNKNIHYREDYLLSKVIFCV